MCLCSHKYTKYQVSNHLFVCPLQDSLIIPIHVKKSSVHNKMVEPTLESPLKKIENGLSLKGHDEWSNSYLTIHI